MFDNRTLIIGELIIPFAFMLIQLIEFGWSEKQAVKDNFAANFFQFTGFLLFLLYDVASDFLTVSISCSFIFISILFMFTTTFKLFNIRVPIKRFRSLGILFFVIFIFIYFTESFYLLFLTMSISFALLCFYGVFYLLTHTKKLQRALIYVISAEFILLGIGSIIHLLFCGVHTSALNNSWETSIYLVESSIFILVWNYTIQLKRNAIIMDDIEENSKLRYKIQDDLAMLNNIYYENNDSNSLYDLYEKMFNQLKKRFNIKYAVIFIKHKEELTAEYSIGFLSHEVELISQENRVQERTEVVSDFVGDLTDGAYKNLILSKGLIGGIFYPLNIRGYSVGSLFLGIVSSSTIVNSDREIMLSISRQVAGIIHSAQMYNEVLESQEKLKKMASTDTLTGIYNRREFFNQFRGEFDGAVRHEDHITLFMIDLDSFSKVNEDYGHDIGDQAIVAVCKVISNQLRSNDLFARYGGEVFTGVLLRGSEKGSIEKLENILEDISKIILPSYPKLKITVSIGCCLYNNNYRNIESMIKRADIALYKAKKKGPNALVIE